MLQVIQQSKEEKVKMYMKLSKKKLVEMLIECNRIIDAMPKFTYTAEPSPTAAIEGIKEESKGEFTGGKWESHHYKGKDVFIIYGNDKNGSLQSIADIKYTTVDGLLNVMQGEKEAEANAQRIAMAVNGWDGLVSVLKDIVSHFDNGHGFTHPHHIKQAKELLNNLKS